MTNAQGSSKLVSMTKKAKAEGLVRIKRDEDGLIAGSGVSYAFDENGFIDWRKMLDDKWLYPNPTKNLKVTDVSKLDDNDLCVLLQGYKEIAQVRGFTNVKYDVSAPSSDYVVATCSIDWIANYETEGSPVTFSAIGDASPNNTNGFGALYLGPMAENRAFVRCVRSFLKIGIVGRDELAANAAASRPVTARASVSTEDKGSSADPIAMLSSLMEEKGVTFASVKKRLVEEEYENADKIQGINQIPKIKAFELIERLKKVKP